MGSGDTMEHSSPKTISPTMYKLTEAVFMTVSGGVFGAAFGGITGTFIIAPMVRRYPRALAELTRTQVLFSFIKTLNPFSNMVSGAGAGLATSFAMKGLKGQPAHALFGAAYFAALAGTFVTIKSRNAQDAFYTEARTMLSKLGLEEYEKNFKKGHLTDPTLPLLTDSVLQEVNIPPGPRLLILDHIERYNKMVNRKRGKQSNMDWL
ncbi:unnamed protein product [Eruca vesicaria subsp. sativa]|uniref:SAM domain-containing protein n=1 Tax=Eruca vesicaria subsp. sativa TaxID=29727 RepID=A0ABC8KWS9_ERUVS|nr:unnamed protein product [Eruca vesicaria subsp. sativa]